MDSVLVVDFMLIGFGLIFAFFGYPVFRILLPIYSGILGYAIGMAIIAPEYHSNPHRLVCMGAQASAASGRALLQPVVDPRRTTRAFSLAASSAFCLVFIGALQPDYRPGTSCHQRYHPLFQGDHHACAGRIVEHVRQRHPA